jgi:hypothetical protein
MATMTVVSPVADLAVVDASAAIWLLLDPGHRRST